MAAKIMPEASYLRECFTYDPAEGVLIWRVRAPHHFRTTQGYKTANTTWAGKPFGSVIRMKSGVSYIRGGINYTDTLAHRVIYKMMTGSEPPHEIDHWDGDGLNNRWTNLREATHQQNQCNTKLRIGTKYPRGVYRIHNNFAAAIISHGKRRNLGTYKTPEEAHAAYLAAAAELHREFAHAAR